MTVRAQFVYPPAKKLLVPGLASPAWELVGLCALVFMYEADDLIANSDMTATFNVIGPIGLIAIMGAGAWHVARNVRDGLWTALFWFRVATIIYFGIGSLIPLFASEATRLYMEATFAFAAGHIRKLNEIVAWSVLVVLATSTVVDKAFGERGSPPAVASSTQTRESATLRIGLAFLAIGETLKYLLIFPNLMGWTSIVLPGAVVQIANSNLVGFYLLTVWSLSRAPRYFPAVLGIIVFEMLMGLLMFNKTSVLYPLVVLTLGVLRSGITMPRVAVIIAAFALSFSILQPLVGYARTIQALQFRSNTAGTLTQRWQILMSFFDPASKLIPDDEVQFYLARLSYTNVAAYVIDRYDRGYPGNSLGGAFAILVPRMLWPEKPIFNPGGDLAAEITGVTGDIVGAGIFAEAYWNFGWGGIPLLMIPFGVILTVMSRFALNVMNREAWIYMPVLFLGVNMGLHVSGAYSIDVMGPTAAALVIGLGCSLIERVLMPESSRRRAGPNIKVRTL